MSKYKNYAVLGLGRFGLSVVKTLSEKNVNILACDKVENRTQEAAAFATHTIQADISDEKVLKSLGLANYDVVIIAMGTEFEAALIAAMVAVEEGAKYIVAKAGGERQKKILESIGVHDVVFPEYEMGVKLANRLSGTNLIDALGDSEMYSLSEISPYPDWIGKSIRECDIRNIHDLTILAIIRSGQVNVPVSPDWIFDENDMLVTLQRKV